MKSVAVSFFMTCVILALVCGLSAGAAIVTYRLLPTVMPDRHYSEVLYSAPLCNDYTAGDMTTGAGIYSGVAYWKTEFDSSRQCFRILPWRQFDRLTGGFRKGGEFRGQ